MKLNILELDEFITLNELEKPNPEIFNKLVNNLSFYKNELNDVLKKSNFINIKLNNRHGYSHTAIAEKQ